MLNPQLLTLEEALKQCNKEIALKQLQLQQLLEKKASLKKKLSELTE